MNAPPHHQTPPLLKDKKKVTEDILNFKLSLLPLHEHFNYTACLSFYKFKEILY